MRIYLVNAVGKTELPLESSKHILSLYNNYLFIEMDSRSSVKAETVFESRNIDPDNKIIPIIWESDNKSAVIIRSEGNTLKYQFQLDSVSVVPAEEVENLLKFSTQMANNFTYCKEYKVEELYDAIKRDNVALIIEKTPYSGYDDQSLLNKISETVPMVMDICSHPKQSLRTEEAVLDVNLVKRVNSRTLDYLSSHSEHWKARTLNGLIPNRLRADILEDEINIYENLFFRMAVDDILKYVHRQAVSIEKTIEQNDNAIDWNAYGEELFDYKRIRVFEQLLPDYDIVQRQNENTLLRSLLNQWRKLEKNFSTIEASQFFRSIDKKKHISRNIKPTNIIKKDSRYNALYRLWCEIQRQNVQDQNDSIDLSGGGRLPINNCYSLYVTSLLLYVFKLLDCTVESDSKFMVTKNGQMIVKAWFESDNIRYVVESNINKYGASEIKITFVEKVKSEYAIPEGVFPLIDSIKRAMPKEAVLDENNRKIIFYQLPSENEQRQLKNIFHLSKSAKKGISGEERAIQKSADNSWRLWLEDLFASGEIKNSRSESLVISPQYIIIENSEAGVDRYTSNLLDGTKGNVIYALPIGLGEYRKNVKSSKLLYRLLNYGEKYLDDDAKRWGNYRTGIIPIAQSEINSAQRLMKLISIHSSRQQIIWGGERIICPICGSSNCTQEGADSWRCKNVECGVLFGKTKHSDGCGKRYEWTRPSVDIKSKDIDLNDTLSIMLKKEIIFDRLTITDFEFEKQSDGKIRYIPVCPICGKRSK